MSNRYTHELARRSFLDFCHFAMRPAFVEQWYHRVIARALQDAAEGRTTRLIIDAPPRHGKSQLVSRLFPAWLAGNRPDWKILGASYADTLARSMSRDVWRIVASDEFRTLWPAWDFGRKRTEEEWDFAGGGSYRAAGTKTGITGRGVNIAIIDDPIASRLQADSPTVRDHIWGWFNDDLLTRLESPGVVIVMATRWHEDDLTGRLLATEPDLWQHIHIPAIYEGVSHPEDPREMGEALWPERYGLDFLGEKRRRDPRGFESLYQGNPTPKGAGMFQADKFQTYASPPEAVAEQLDWLVISVDATFGKSKHSDFVGLVVLGGKGNRLFVLDEKHARMDFTETKQAIIEMRRRWPRAQVLIEERANGPALIEDLSRTIGRVVGFKPGRDSKETRAQYLSQIVESGDFYVPSATWAPWVPAFIAEFAGFPGKAHDDRVDACSQAALYKIGALRGLDHLRRITSGGWLNQTERW